MSVMTLSSKLEFGAGVRRRSVDIDLTGVGQDGCGAVSVEVVADDA